MGRSIAQHIARFSVPSTATRFAPSQDRKSLAGRWRCSAALARAITYAQEVPIDGVFRAAARCFWLLLHLGQAGSLNSAARRSLSFASWCLPFEMLTLQDIIEDNRYFLWYCATSRASSTPRSGGIAQLGSVRFTEFCVLAPALRAADVRRPPTDHT